MTSNWIHCNACFTEKDVPLSMINCGHVICNSCLSSQGENRDKPTCIVCGNANPKIVPLTKDLNAGIALLFNGTDNVMKQGLKVYHFEKYHREILLNHYKFRAKQSTHLAEEVERLRKECKRHSDDKNKLKNDLIEKTKMIKRLTNQLEAKKVHTVGDLFSNGTPAASQLRDNKQQHSGPRPSHSPFSLVDSGAFSSSSNNSNRVDVFTPPQDPPSLLKNKLYRNFDALRTTSSGAPSPLNVSLHGSSGQQSQAAMANRRRVYLPGDHRGKENSNVTKIGLHQLNVSKPNQLTSTFWNQKTSTPIKTTSGASLSGTPGSANRNSFLSTSIRVSTPKNEKFVRYY